MKEYEYDIFNALQLSHAELAVGMVVTYHPSSFGPEFSRLVALRGTKNREELREMLALIDSIRRRQVDLVVTGFEPSLVLIEERHNRLEHHAVCASMLTTPKDPPSRPVIVDGRGGLRSLTVVKDMKECLVTSGVYSADVDAWLTRAARDLIKELGKRGYVVRKEGA